jgi:hypothetical protein
MVLLALLFTLSAASNCIFFSATATAMTIQMEAES